MNATDVILEGLAYTVMGLCIVFLILVIIMLVIKAMALFGSERKGTVSSPQPESSEAPALQQESEPQTNEGEIIAAITAAIAVMMNTDSSGIIIRSYRKVPDEAWKKASLREALENRF